MSGTAGQTERQTFDGLDVLRGVAAICVLLRHMSDFFSAPWLMPSGALAVDLFFVISGFVIAHAYSARLRQLGVAGFMRFRAVRFYPLYLLGLAIGVAYLALIISTGHQTFSLRDVLTAAAFAALFLPAPVSPLSRFGLADGHSIAPVDSPGWSLILEMWVNLFYALISPRLSNRVLAALVGMSGGYLVAGSLAAGHWGGWTWESFDFGVARTVMSFFLGVLIFEQRACLPRLAWLSGLPGLALAAACFMMPKSIVFDLMFVFLISPAIVAAEVTATKRYAFAPYFAAMSYCVYAIHEPMVFFLNSLASKLALPRPLLGIAFICGLLALSPLLDRFYDRPLRRFLLARRPPPATDEEKPQLAAA